MEYILKLQGTLAKLEAQHFYLTGEARIMNQNMIQGVKDLLHELNNTEGTPGGEPCTQRQRQRRGSQTGPAGTDQAGEPTRRQESAERKE